jgi:hypothetical protein
LNLRFGKYHGPAGGLLCLDAKKQKSRLHKTWLKMKMEREQKNSLRSDSFCSFPVHLHFASGESSSREIPPNV